MWNLLLGPIVKAVGGFFKDKAKLKQAKLDGEIQIIKSAAQNVATWEQLHARGSQSSWKDEFWTIVWSVPLILAFIKIEGVFDGPAIAAEGFSSFALMPEWYQYTLVTMVLASFGIRAGGTIKSLMGKS